MPFWYSLLGYLVLTFRPEFYCTQCYSGTHYKGIWYSLFVKSFISRSVILVLTMRVSGTHFLPRVYFTQCHSGTHYKGIWYSLFAQSLLHTVSFWYSLLGYLVPTFRPEFIAHSVFLVLTIRVSGTHFSPRVLLHVVSFWYSLLGCLVLTFCPEFISQCHSGTHYKGIWYSLFAQSLFHTVSFWYSL